MISKTYLIVAGLGLSLATSTAFACENDPVYCPKAPGMTRGADGTQGAAQRTIDTVPKEIQQNAGTQQKPVETAPVPPISTRPNTPPPQSTPVGEACTYTEAVNQGAQKTAPSGQTPFTVKFTTWQDWEQLNVSEVPVADQFKYDFQSYLGWDDQCPMGKLAPIYETVSITVFCDDGELRPASMDGQFARPVYTGDVATVLDPITSTEYGCNYIDQADELSGFKEGLILRIQRVTK